MQHRVSLLVLVLSVLGMAACTSASGGHGDDDDDLIIDQGDGDADADADADADGDAGGTCQDACAQIVNICEGADLQYCNEYCGRFAQYSDGACADRFSDYNGCVAGAATCDPQNGPQGCDAEGSAVDSACANGCHDLVSCVNACADGDDACQQACVTNADRTGALALQALLTCWTDACGDPPAADADQATQDAFDQCLNDSCQDEYVQCR